MFDSSLWNDFIESSKGLKEDFRSFLILLSVSIIAILVSFLIFKIVSAVVRRFSGSSYTIIRKHLSLPFRMLLTVVCLNVAQTFTYFKTVDNQVVHKILYLALVFTIAYALMKITEFIRDVLYERFDITVANNLNERKIRTQIDFIQKAGSVFIIFIGIAIALMSFERVRQLGTSLIASAGIVSVIIGFAAQKSLANLLAGLQIAFTQPVRIEDVVVVEGEWGRIEEITLTYVVVRIWDSRRLIVPISYFLEKPFQNWTRTSSDLLGTVFLYADYSLPVDAIRMELVNILRRPDVQNLWDENKAIVQVTDATESTLQIRILVSAANSSDAFDLRCAVREHMIDFITKNYPDALPKKRVLDKISVNTDSRLHP